MPFVRGRFYANPIAGEAIEAAREVEDALASSQDVGNSDEDGRAAQPGTQPVRRIEIEIAELVPAHSGRATTGYVAHLDRGNATESRADSYAGKTQTEKRVFYDQGQLLSFLKNELANNGDRR
jgi:hypothetical protein